MGSLVSRPKVPSVQPIQAVSAPVSIISEPVAQDTQTAEQGTAEVRTESLLGRSRSRLGTIKTSFRGLLGLSNTQGSRKTLLGE